MTAAGGSAHRILTLLHDGDPDHYIYGTVHPGGLGDTVHISAVASAPCSDDNQLLTPLFETLLERAQLRRRRLRREPRHAPFQRALVGAGASATVFRVQRRADPQKRVHIVGDAADSALKAIPVSNRPKERQANVRAVENELKTLRKLADTGTPLLAQHWRDAFYAPLALRGGIVFMPMELLDTTLRAYIAEESTDEAGVRRVLHRLAVAMLAIGDRFVHGDMHGNNVMIRRRGGEVQPALIDFGFSQYLDDAAAADRGADARMLIGYLCLSRTAGEKTKNSLPALTAAIADLENGAEVAEQRDRTRRGRGTTAVPRWYMFYAKRISNWDPATLDRLRNSMTFETLRSATVDRPRLTGGGERVLPIGRPVQVGPSGARTLLQRGGTLILYDKDSPQSLGLYDAHSDHDEASRLARAMHKAGLGVTAVARGPRVAPHMQTQEWRLDDEDGSEMRSESVDLDDDRAYYYRRHPPEDYPLVFMTDAHGNVTRYRGDLTADAMLQAYKDHVGPRNSASHGSVQFIGTPEELRAFMQRGSGVVALTKPGCPACEEWVPANGERGMLHDVAAHPRILSTGVQVGHTDGPAFRERAPEALQSAIESYPAFLVIENGKQVFVYDGDPRVDAIVDAASR